MYEYDYFCVVQIFVNSMSNHCTYIILYQLAITNDKFYLCTFCEICPSENI